MNEQTKAKIQRILDNYNRQLVESHTNKKINVNLIAVGALMKLMRILIGQMDKLENALTQEGVI